MISLGSWARGVRDIHGLSRPRAGLHVGVSGDFLKNLEEGMRPSEEYLDKFITGYQLDSAQARLTWDLWRPAVALPPVEQLREQIATPERLELLALLDRCGIVAAYIDPLWNIVAANESVYRILPETMAHTARTAGNLALGMLPPTPARSPIAPLLLDRDREIGWLVSNLRGAFGRYRTSPQACRLYQQLRRNRAFTTRWNTSIHVAHGRSPDEPLRLRHPATKLPYTLALQITDVSDLPEVRYLTAWPPPQPGPPPRE
ncbi:hypothetical protein [Nocardia sp. GP40]|uniref:MmyB family transcriptional regulator n=1 Tax=Nocardia sp. GP40 TaxID=3156268 RepID=UPI003D1D76AA